MLQTTQTSQPAQIPFQFASLLTHKVYYFHTVRITCFANNPALFTHFDTFLGHFDEPPTCIDHLTWYLLSYESPAEFPVPLPDHRVRQETVRLLPGTRFKHYTSMDGAFDYQSFAPLISVNGTALTMVDQAQGLVVTQLAQPALFQASFLRRYLLLLALGQALERFHFAPCHAATITSPWNTQQGALLIGDSGSGKTTLSLGCTLTGCGFAGDDLIMLRAQPAQHEIQAFAITHEIAVRPNTLDLWPQLDVLRQYPTDRREKRYCSIEQIRPGSAINETTVRLVIFPEISDDTLSSTTPLSKVAALQRLVDLCMRHVRNSSQSQQRLFLLLSQLADHTPAYRLSIARGATDGPQLVQSLFTHGADR